MEKCNMQGQYMIISTITLRHSLLVRNYELLEIEEERITYYQSFDPVSIFEVRLNCNFQCHDFCIEKKMKDIPACP